MKTTNLDFIDFESVNTLLEGFNQSTGFVTSILDLEGNVLSKSGWRQICTQFHRVNPETAKRCTLSDTVLANKMSNGEKYHFYECLNGLVDVAVPIVIKGEHVANLFSGQFFFKKPDTSFFRKQANDYGFEEGPYLKALAKVPVVSKEKVKTAMDFLLNMTQMISEITYQKMEQSKQIESKKKSEAALKESEEKYRSFFENSMDAVLLTEPDGAILAVNPSACSLFGRNESEIIERGRAGVVDLNDPRLPGLLSERGKTGKAKGELSFFRNDGSVFPGEITSAIFIDAAGKRKTSMIIRDITDRKLAEEALSLSEQKFNKAFHNSPDAITITRASDGLLVDVNEALVRISGYTRDESIGHTSTELKLWTSTLDRDRYVQILMEKGSVKDYETTFRTKSGEIRHFVLSGEMYDLNNEKYILGIIRDITEKRKLETEVRESEEKYRYMFANNPQPMWIYDLETLSFLEVNDAAINNYGYTREEFLLMTLKDIRPKEDIEALLKDVELTRKTYNPAGEWRHLKKNGEIIIVDIISHTITFNNRKARHVIVNDITERKKAEKTIIAKQELFRKTFNISPLSSVLTKLPERIIVEVNPAFEKLFGYTGSEIVGRPISELVLWANSSEQARVAKKVLEKGKVYDHEFEFMTKNGIIGNGIFYAEVVEQLDEKFVLTKVMDITERKQSEEKLRASEEGFRQIFESANVGKSITLITGEINVNKAFCDMLGYSKNELQNKKWQEITPSDEINVIQQRLEPLLNGTLNANRFEKRYLHKNGTHIWTDVSVVMHRDTNQKPLFFITTIVDITDRKLAEELLKKLNDELEFRVSERTFQLEAANKELEAFSYSVSHDLRSPLRHINSFAEILTKKYSDQLPDDAKKHLNTITGSAKKMGTLIDDLISFSRTGRAELKKSTLKMNQVIEDALTQINPSVKDRKIEWEISSLPNVHGDYNLLRLAWVNLLDNAVKYTKNKEKAVIQIGCKEEKNEIIFHIKDNGVGFDMIYADKLFGVFQRLHSSAQFEGTGIGLANVQRIILRHGGRIWAEAETDKGATFYFSIPK